MTRSVRVGGAPYSFIMSSSLFVATATTLYSSSSRTGAGGIDTASKLTLLAITEKAQAVGRNGAVQALTGGQRRISVVK